MQGHGSGLAVLQLTSRYHVTKPEYLLAPPTPTFLLNSQASWQGRNGSSIAFYTCIKWLFTESSDASGLTVLEVSVPTGYGASPEKLNDLVLSKKVPNLRWAEFAQRKATFFFERVRIEYFFICLSVHLYCIVHQIGLTSSSVFSKGYFLTLCLPVVFFLSH